MSLGSFCQTQSQITQILFVVFLCFGYFNYPLIVDLISFFFKISSFTGKILVEKSLSCLNLTSELCRLIYLFLQILYEDCVIFLKDVLDKFTFLVFILQQIYFFVESFLWNIFKGILHLKEIISSVLSLFYFTLVWVKEGIQLLGATIFNVFINLPEVIIFNINELIKFCLNTMYEIKKLFFKGQDKIVEMLVKTYLFFFDFQMNSIYGLIIGVVCLTVIYVKFKDICCFVKCVFLKVYQQFISFGISLWNGRFLEQPPRRNTNPSFDDDDRLCIVCQHKLKEIIIFPCKHLCLCGDCSLKLTKSQPYCPICRSNITGTLKVYL